MNIEPLDPSQPSRAQLKVEMDTVCRLNFKTHDARKFRQLLAKRAYVECFTKDRIDKN